MPQRQRQRQQEREDNVSFENDRAKRRKHAMGLNIVPISPVHFSILAVSKVSIEYAGLDANSEIINCELLL